MKKTSIGTWAYNVGPYGENPIPFDTVGETLSKLKFDGLELGGFNGYPNPHNHPEKEQREALFDFAVSIQPRKPGTQISDRRRSLRYADAR